MFFFNFLVVLKKSPDICAYTYMYICMYINNKNKFQIQDPGLVVIFALVRAGSYMFEKSIKKTN